VLTHSFRDGAKPLRRFAVCLVGDAAQLCNDTPFLGLGSRLSGQNAGRFGVNTQHLSGPPLVLRVVWILLLLPELLELRHWHSMCGSNRHSRLLMQ